MSEIRVCTEAEQASTPSDIVICDSDSSPNPSDIRVCEDDADLCSTPPPVALSISGDVDVAIGEIYTATGGYPPYSYSFDDGTIDSSGEVQTVGSCTGSGTSAMSSVNVEDICGNTASIEVRLPSGHWELVSTQNNGCVSDSFCGGLSESGCCINNLYSETVEDYFGGADTGDLGVGGLSCSPSPGVGMSVGSVTAADTQYRFRYKDWNLMTTGGFYCENRCGTIGSPLFTITGGIFTTSGTYCNGVPRTSKVDIFQLLTYEWQC